MDKKKKIMTYIVFLSLLSTSLIFNVSSAGGYETYIYFNNDNYVTLTDFPVMVHISNPVIDFSKINAECSDVAFYDKNNNLLPFILEDYTSGVEAWFWVNVTQINASNNDYILMKYGDPSYAGLESTDGNVWNSNFKLVQHFSNCAIRRTEPNLMFKSDVINVSDATPVNLADSDINITGKIAGGVSFDGTNDYLHIGIMPYDPWELWGPDNSDQKYCHHSTIQYYNNQFWFAWQANNETGEGTANQYIACANSDDIDTLIVCDHDDFGLHDDYLKIGPYTGTTQFTPMFYNNPYDNTLWLTWMNNTAGGSISVGPCYKAEYDNVADSWSAESKFWNASVTNSSENGIVDTCTGFCSAPITLDNGDIIWTISIQNDTARSQSRTAFLRSTDDTATWTNLSSGVEMKVPVPGSSYDSTLDYIFMESTVIQCPNNYTLVGYLRDDWGTPNPYIEYLWKTFSYDNGSTWSTPTMSDIHVSPPSKATIKELSNGNYLVLYNKNYGPATDRRTLCFRQSEDGVSWGSEYIVYDESGICYPDFIEEDGVVYACSSANSPGVHRGQLNAYVCPNTLDMYALEIDDEITFSSWVYIDSLDSSEHDIVCKNGCWGIKQTSANDILGYVVTAGGTNTVSFTNPVANTWYYVSVVYDGTNCYLYINGELTDTDTLHSGDIITNSNPVYIGCDESISDFFDGKIDELIIVSHAFNSDESSAYYDSVNADFISFDNPLPSVDNFEFIDICGKQDVSGLFVAFQWGNCSIPPNTTLPSGSYSIPEYNEYQVRVSNSSTFTTTFINESGLPKWFNLTNPVEHLGDHYYQFRVKVKVVTT